MFNVIPESVKSLVAKIIFVINNLLPPILLAINIEEKIANDTAQRQAIFGTLFGLFLAY